MAQARPMPPRAPLNEFTGAASAGRLGPGKSAAEFEVRLPKQTAGLGVKFANEYMEAAAETKNAQYLRVTGFGQIKVDGSMRPGEAESSGLIRAGDIVIAVNGERLDEPGRSIKEIMASTKEAPELSMQLLRPAPFAQLRGVVSLMPEIASEAVAALGAEAAKGLFCAVWVHEPSGQHIVGPYATQEDAAAAFDDVLLSSCGLRAASSSNYWRHWSDRVQLAEHAARAAEARGDVEGARAVLDAVRAGKYTYAGSGAVEIPTARHEGADACGGVALRHHVRPEPAQMTQYRFGGAPLVTTGPFGKLGGLAAVAPAHAFQASTPPAVDASPEAINASAAHAGSALRAALFTPLSGPVLANVAASAPSVAAAIAAVSEDDGAGHADAPKPVGTVFGGSYAPPLEAYAAHALVKAGMVPSGSLSVLAPGVPMPPGGASEGAAFPPRLMFPPVGVAVTPPWQACDPHPGYGDHYCSRSDNREKVRCDARGVGRRARALPPTTLLQVVGPAPASAEEDAQLASVVATAVGTAAPQSRTGNWVAIHGGPGEPHPLFRGVRFAADGTGAFAVFRRSIQADFVGSWPPQDYDEAQSVVREAEEVLNHYPSAVHAALAYDRHARRTYPDALAADGVHCNLPDWVDPPAVRAERGGDGSSLGSASGEALAGLLRLSQLNLVANRPELLGMPVAAWVTGRGATAAMMRILAGLAHSVGEPAPAEGAQPILMRAALACAPPATRGRYPPNCPPGVLAELLMDVLPHAQALDPHPMLRDLGLPLRARDDPMMQVAARPAPGVREHMQHRLHAQAVTLRDIAAIFDAEARGQRMNFPAQAPPQAVNMAIYGNPAGPTPPPGMMQAQQQMQAQAQAQQRFPAPGPGGPFPGRGGFGGAPRGGRGGAVFRGRGRGRGRGGRGRRGRDSDEESDDFDDDDDYEEGDEEAAPRRGGRFSTRGRGRGRGGRRGGRDEDDDGMADDDDDDEFEDAGARDDEDDGPRRFKRKRAPESKVAVFNASAAPADEEDTQLKIDRILAARYADLPSDPNEDAEYEDEDAATEDDRARAHDKAQAAKRLALPLEARRHWETLEYLVRWKGLSYLHVEWVSPSLLKEMGHWGKIRAQRYM